MGFAPLLKTYHRSKHGSPLFRVPTQNALKKFCHVLLGFPPQRLSKYANPVVMLRWGRSSKISRVERLWLLHLLEKYTQLHPWSSACSSLESNL
jgi:hypothetical protein